MPSPEQLKSAVESMFRIRAVESPPDAAGLRRIWHRGTRGAELVTVVDATGTVVQQDFTLFDDAARWDRHAGFRFGRVEVAAATGELPQTVVVEEGTDRLARFKTALEAYSGSDRFIRHLREQLIAKAIGEPPRDIAPDAAEVDALPTPVPRPELPRRGRGLLIGALLVVVGLTVIVALWRR